MTTLNQSRSAAIEMAEQSARMVLRLIGPRMSAADCLQDQFKISRCAKCDPDPTVYTCPICDYTTTAKYQMQVHNIARPPWCDARGNRKIKAWAAKS